MIVCVCLQLTLSTVVMAGCLTHSSDVVLVGYNMKSKKKKKGGRESDLANLSYINKEYANKNKNVYGRVCVCACVQLLSTITQYNYFLLFFCLSAILTPSHPCTQGEEFDETTKSCVGMRVCSFYTRTPS